MPKVIMQFNGHDVEGDAATLADINTKLTEHAAMARALQDIAAYPLSVPGYNSAGALLLRLAAVQTIARKALASVTGAQS